MENFSERLKEERVRLGMSQAKFAESCGVGKSAQYSYENGGREPPLSYVRAAEKLGVDIFYLERGVRIGKDGVYSLTYKRILEKIGRILALDRDVIDKICEKGVRLEEKNEWKGDSWELSGAKSWEDEIQAWLATSALPNTCIDEVLLASLLDSVAESAAKLGLSITTEKCVRAALMLYPHARQTEHEKWPKIPFLDKFSQDLIDKTVKLAGS